MPLTDPSNQVNNILAFPGIFRGAIDARATRIDEAMKLAAAEASAACIEAPTAGRVLPDALDPRTARAVADAVARTIASGV